MFDLMDLGRAILPTSPGIDVEVRDIHIDIEPSDYLIPSIHIDGHVDIRFPW